MLTISNFVCWPEPKSGRYLLSWDAEGSHSVKFRILYALLPDATPEIVGEDIDGYLFEARVEGVPLNFSDDVFFWIEAVSDDTGLVIASVGPVKDSHVPERRHFLYHREVLRRTELDINRYYGSRVGYLLRKRMYGQIAQTVNPILGMPIGQEDPSSFGEKYDFGYHDPVEMMCGYSDEKGEPQMLKTIETGDSDPRVLMLTTTHFPPIKVGDVWVNADSNDRYKIISKVRSVKFRNLPVKQEGLISLLPNTDRVYEISV